MALSKRRQKLHHGNYISFSRQAAVLFIYFSGKSSPMSPSAHALVFKAASRKRPVGPQHAKRWKVANSDCTAQTDHLSTSSTLVQPTSTAASNLLTPQYSTSNYTKQFQLHPVLSLARNSPLADHRSLFSSYQPTSLIYPFFLQPDLQIIPKLSTMKFHFLYRN